MAYDVRCMLHAVLQKLLVIYRFLMMLVLITYDMLKNFFVLSEYQTEKFFTGNDQYCKIEYVRILKIILNEITHTLIQVKFIPNMRKKLDIS